MDAFINLRHKKYHGIFQYKFLSDTNKVDGLWGKAIKRNKTLLQAKSLSSSSSSSSLSISPSSTSSPSSIHNDYDLIIIITIITKT
ncbi:hypothetical protein Glove_158g42 [Diversispora epigaea]|uniref:Uncharacterized protein n=1 Tax=Diversispora epigaea TaxID=1348612 RepID=A0A397J197_9GLOM|nr:hypothetical protein Glove_158g42 [Diversispora epigaea]